MNLNEMFDKLRKKYWDVQLFNLHIDNQCWLLRIKRIGHSGVREYKGLFVRTLIKQALMDADN